MIIITNLTTNSTEIFNLEDEYSANKMLIFLRKATIDFCFSFGAHYITLDNGQELCIDEDTPELNKWIFAGLLYSLCVNNGEWGDIVTIYDTED